MPDVCQPSEEAIQTRADTEPEPEPVSSDVTEPEILQHPQSNKGDTFLIEHYLYEKAFAFIFGFFILLFHSRECYDKTDFFFPFFKKFFILSSKQFCLMANRRR